MNRDLRAMLGKARELLEEVRVWWQKRTPVVRIADVRDGQFVRIAGRIVDGEPLTAPITARRCVCSTPRCSATSSSTIAATRSEIGCSRGRR
ncbi:MAG TPA: hypothetical protein VM734_17205 [Kofleriaceae bacterium]|nr:hypothetical protein [Kofleriaceae bacterium]